MKKFILLCLSVLFIQSTVNAGNKVRIQFSNLPAKAQQMIAANFDKSKIAVIKKEGRYFSSYDVIFTNGSEIEFNNNGEWEEIDCKRSSVPSNLIPSAIKNYLAKNYPNVRVVKIEKDRAKIEVELANDLELTFDSNYNLIDIDY